MSGYELSNTDRILKAFVGVSRAIRESSEEQIQRHDLAIVEAVGSSTLSCRIEM